MAWGGAGGANSELGTGTRWSVRPDHGSVSRAVSGRSWFPNRLYRSGTHPPVAPRRRTAPYCGTLRAFGPTLATMAAARLPAFVRSSRAGDRATGFAEMWMDPTASQW